MSKFFGTDGFRGKVGDLLTAEKAFRVGKFLAWHKIRGNGIVKPVRVLIGKDTRKSSYTLEYAISAGLTSMGADAYLMHVTTTPSVAFITKTEVFDYGIMISASHNPYYDNGIKIINSQGEKVGDELILPLEEYLSSDKDYLAYAESEKVGKVVDYLFGRNKYSAYLSSLLPYSLKGKKIVLDYANGASYKIAKAVYESLGATIISIGDNPNGLNINENCGSTSIDALRKKVLEVNADVGFAFDGDADRCIAVDEFGRVVDGDKMIFVLANYLKEIDGLFNNKVVLTVMSNLGLVKELNKNSITVETTKVGDRYVYEKMKEESLSLGGESSGHIIISKYATTGDGILTSLKICEVMLTKNRSLSSLCDGIILYPQITKNINVMNKEECVQNENVLKAVETAKDFIGSEGRVLFRASGTENVVRVMVESKSEEDCMVAIGIVEKAVKKENLLNENQTMKNS